MDEKNSHIKNRLGEQLPSHSPDPGAWQRLSAKMDAIDAEAAYHEKLQGLPVHSPDQGAWNIISSRLNRIAYYKTGIRIALSAAAGLLLFFTVSRVSENYNTKTIIRTQKPATQEQRSNPTIAAVQPNIDVKQRRPLPLRANHNTNIKPGNNKLSFTTGNRESNTSDSQLKTVQSDNKTNIIATLNQQSIIIASDNSTSASNNLNAIIHGVTGKEAVVKSEINTPTIAQVGSTQNKVSPEKEITNTDIEPRSILFQKEPYTTSATSAKPYSPPAPVTAGTKNHIALSMNYLPENIYNGTDNSLFHNVDLTASYNKEKVRFNTSLGMAYNEEQLEFNMTYDINTPVTAMGPGGKVDTLSYNSSNMESEYIGTEKHKYVTYNLGFGRRIFSAGKFSTWFNAGAGFGVQLNNPDLITSTTNSIKAQYNAQSFSVKSSKPVYNDVNINFVTAIDFNYQILKKVSITFTPTSRWYFKPVLLLNNQATDELTLGFRTGLKLDF